MYLRELLIGGRHPLGYCTNVHPAADLDEAAAVLRDKAAPILDEALGPGPKLLAAWWPEAVARTLAEDEASRAGYAELCAGLGLRPLSLNAFPMGRFHGEAVKLQVYQPAWGEAARLAYTLDAAAAVADLGRRLGFARAVLSTVPLGFRGVDRELRPGEDQVRDLFLCAQALARIEDESGVHVEVALEPEPWCQLETVAEALRWFDEELLPFAARQGAEATARRHLGICLDLCHAAVVGEDPVAAARTIEASGLRLAKVQLSICPRARGPEGLGRLLALDEPVWLHQAFSRAAAGPWMDLSDPGLRAHVPAANEEILAHFHWPLHDPGDPALETTQDGLLRFVDFVREGGLRAGTTLEVETYTNPAIAAELAFVVGRLTGD